MFGVQTHIFLEQIDWEGSSYPKTLISSTKMKKLLFVLNFAISTGSKMFKNPIFLLYCSSREVVIVLHRISLPLNHVKSVIKWEIESIEIRAYTL